MSNQPDEPAYGEDYEQSRGSGGPEGDRGIVGDTFRYLKGRYKQSQQPQQQYGYGQPQTGQQQEYGQGYGATQPQYGQGSYVRSRLVQWSQLQELIELQNPNVPQQTQSSYSSSQGQQQKPDLATKIFDGLHGALYGIGTDIAGKLGTHYEPQPYGTYAGQGGYNPQSAPRNRFGSFATLKNGNDVKWYVDGCSYMWAVSKALEGAKHSIWILDCRSRRSWQIYPPPP
jgi:phospholipase D1/2